MKVHVFSSPGYWKRCAVWPFTGGAVDAQLSSRFHAWHLFERTVRVTVEHMTFDGVGALVGVPTIAGAREGIGVGTELGTREGLAVGAEGAFETVGDGEG